MLSAQADDARRKPLFGTFTLQSCATQDIRSTARAAIAGWRNLVNNTAVRHIAGWFRLLEITSDQARPNLEYVHLHAVMVMAPAYAGRYHLNRAQWRQLWQASVGTIYRGVDVATIRNIDAAAAYVADARKFEAEAEIAIEDAGRYIGRAEQTRHLRRYQGHGLLGEGPGAGYLDQITYRGRQAERTAIMRRYEPIPIEGQEYRSVHTVQ